MTSPGNATRRMLQRSIIRPSTGTVSAEQIPPNDKANDAVPRCHPISAMIGFRNTPKVNPRTGPLHTMRPPTAPPTTHQGLVKLSRIAAPPFVAVVDGPARPTAAVGWLSRPAARCFFAQHCDQTLHLSAIMLDDGSELGALGDRHTDAVDRDIADLVDAVSSGQPPVHLDRRGAGGADDLSRYDGAIGIKPAAPPPELLAGVLGQAGTVSERDVVLEQLDVLRPLLLGCRIPVAAEDKAGDPRDVEILAQQFAKPRHPLRLGGTLTEHLESPAPQIADQSGRVRGCRCRDGGSKCSREEDQGGSQEATSHHYFATSDMLDASETTAARRAAVVNASGDPRSSRWLKPAGGGRFSRSWRISAARRCR